MPTGGERRRFVCLCWSGLEMRREPFKPFVRLNFCLCYICRLRFRQTSSNVKAWRRYYAERMTTCAAEETREDEKSRRDDGWRHKRWHVCVFVLQMQVMQIKALWLCTVKRRLRPLCPSVRLASPFHKDFTTGKHSTDSESTIPTVFITCVSVSEGSKPAQRMENGVVKEKNINLLASLLA